MGRWKLGPSWLREYSLSKGRHEKEAMYVSRKREQPLQRPKEEVCPVGPETPRRPRGWGRESEGDSG